MTDPKLNPEQSPTWEKEYQDPQYHDEDLEIQADDQPRRPGYLPAKKKGNRRPPPRRHYDED